MSNEVRTCRASRATIVLPRRWAGTSLQVPRRGSTQLHYLLARRARCGVRNCATRHKIFNGIVLMLGWIAEFTPCLKLCDTSAARRPPRAPRDCVWCALCRVHGRPNLCRCILSIAPADLEAVLYRIEGMPGVAW